MRVKWMRWAVLLLGASTFFVVGVLVWMNDGRAPKERITFLGYTNIANKEMAMFTIWEPKNLQSIGTVYTETGIGGGWSFDNRSNLQASLRASGLTLTESLRGLPVRVEKPADTPDRLLVAVPVSSAPAKWRLVVQYRPARSRWRTAREKTAAFLTQYGASRLSQWVQPRREKYFGPVMGSDDSGR